MSDWKKVGTVYVDSGTIMVGDPCYTQGADASHASKDWMDFLAKTWPENFGLNATPHGSMENVVPALGEKGVGMVVSSGFGDGEYPVYVKYSDEGMFGTRVAEVKVVFIDDEEGEDDGDDYLIDENEGEDY